MALRFDVIEYPHDMNEELIYGFPESRRDANFMIGTYVIVRAEQNAVLCKDGRVLDIFGPGKHIINLNNIPMMLSSMDSQNFDSHKLFPFQAYFISIKENKGSWSTSEPFLAGNARVGVALLEARGSFSFMISNPRQFMMNAIGGWDTRKSYSNAVNHLHSLLLVNLQDTLVEFCTTKSQSLLEIINRPQSNLSEIALSTRIKSKDEFEAIGFTLTQFNIFNITSLKSTDNSAERLHAMGSLGRHETSWRFNQEMSTNVFLSYARPDQTAVEQVFRFLSGNGFEPWMDVVSIRGGQDWEYAIKRGIENSTFFIACLSKSSYDRRGVFQKEINQALDKWAGMLPDDAYLIPLRLEDVQFPERLKRFQAIDWYKPDGPQRLLNTLKTELERRRP